MMDRWSGWGGGKNRCVKEDLVRSRRERKDRGRAGYFKLENSMYVPTGCRLSRHKMLVRHDLKGKNIQHWSFVKWMMNSSIK